ncbi:CPBP family intramembrane glutamic endopeptidase [Hoylesella marshii]|uniref:CPBP family intramembrane glutamic endopeptidase n=1 Tax=Hoylesella marshii TaxID=189722 RepID=UPI0028D5D58A|nr:CPBP family intramembrane glutamic endopeptidase [Hoylesella marshii]
MKQAIQYLVAFVLIQVVAALGCRGAWMLFSHGSTDLTPTQIIVISSLSSLSAIALFTWRRWYDRSRAYLQSRPWSVVFWCILLALGTLLPSQWLAEQMPESWVKNLYENEFDMVLRHPFGYVTVGLLASVAEEIVFRGAILRALLSSFNHRWAGIVLSSLLFAIIHGNPAQMPHAFLAGLILGWMYSKTRSIVPGIVFHWTNNTAAYILYNLIPNAADARLSDFFGDNKFSLYLSLAFSCLIFLPALFQLYLRMKPADAPK